MAKETVYLHVFAPDGADISRDIELANGRSSLMWSQYDIQLHGRHIGWLESGSPMDFIDGYTFDLRDYPPPEKLAVPPPPQVGELEANDGTG